MTKNRDISVGTTTVYWLDGRGFSAGARDFSLLHNVETLSGAYPASYPMGMLGCFLDGKAAGV
jgi:hypothetical protein